MSQETPSLPASSATKTASKPRKARPAKPLLNSGQNLDPASASLSKRLRTLPTRHRKSEALRRLGVKPEQLRTAPDISSILKETRHGIKLAIGALRFSSNDAVKDFLKKYDTMPVQDREHVPIEAIALAVGVDIRLLLGEIMLSVREHSVSRVKIIALASHPEVIKSRVKFAKQVGGYRDRDALDTMLGALPRPNAATFIDKVFFGKPEAEKKEAEEVEDEPMTDEDWIFPDASEIQDRIQPMRQRLLEEGK